MRNLKNRAAFALVLTLGSLLPSAYASAAIHCEGVSTKWVNGCGSTAYGGHSCASKAEGDFHPKEWLKFSKKDCTVIQSALKNENVKTYILSMRDDVLSTGQANPTSFTCAKDSAKTACKVAKKIVSSKVLKKYVKKIAKGTLVAKKRGKKF